MAIRDRAALQASVFYRLAAGAGRSTRIIAQDAAEDVLAPSADAEALSARERRTASQALFYWRETQRRIDGMTKRAAHREGVNDTGSAYLWKPARSARRTFA